MHVQLPCAVSLLCHFLFYQQIFSEFNRIFFEKEIIKDIKEVWSEMVPKFMSLKMNLMQNLSHYMKKVLHVLLKVWLDTITTQYSYWLYTWHFAECKSLFASMMLVHLLQQQLQLVEY